MKNNADDKTLADLLMMAYVDEPCRICGRMIQEEDLPTLKYAGYSDVFPGARSMHLRCAQGVVDILKSTSPDRIEGLIDRTPMPEVES